MQSDDLFQDMRSRSPSRIEVLEKNRMIRIERRKSELERRRSSLRELTMLHRSNSQEEEEQVNEIIKSYLLSKYGKIWHAKSGAGAKDASSVNGRTVDIEENEDSMSFSGKVRMNNKESDCSLRDPSSNSESCSSELFCDNSNGNNNVLVNKKKQSLSKRSNSGIVEDKSGSTTRERSSVNVSSGGKKILVKPIKEEESEGTKSGLPEKMDHADGEKQKGHNKRLDKSKGDAKQQISKSNQKLVRDDSVVSEQDDPRLSLDSSAVGGDTMSESQTSKEGKSRVCEEFGSSRDETIISETDSNISGNTNRSASNESQVQKHKTNEEVRVKQIDKYRVKLGKSLSRIENLRKRHRSICEALVSEEMVSAKSPSDTSERVSQGTSQDDATNSDDGNNLNAATISEDPNNVNADETTDDIVKRNPDDTSDDCNSANAAAFCDDDDDGAAATSEKDDDIDDVTRAVTTAASSGIDESTERDVENNDNDKQTIEGESMGAPVVIEVFVKKGKAGTEVWYLTEEEVRKILKRRNYVEKMGKEKQKIKDIQHQNKASEDKAEERTVLVLTKKEIARLKRWRYREAKRKGIERQEEQLAVSRMKHEIWTCEEGGVDEAGGDDGKQVASGGCADGNKQHSVSHDDNVGNIERLDNSRLDLNMSEKIEKSDANQEKSSEEHSNKNGKQRNSVKKKKITKSKKRNKDSGQKRATNNSSRGDFTGGGSEVEQRSDNRIRVNLKSREDKKCGKRKRLTKTNKVAPMAKKHVVMVTKADGGYFYFDTSVMSEKARTRFDEIKRDYGFKEGFKDKEKTIVLLNRTV